MKNKLLTQEQIINREIELYKQSLKDINVDDKIPIYDRKCIEFVEYDFNMPQTIFYITNNNTVILGRKTISQLYLNNQLKSINCSNITQNMLLGILKDCNYKDRKILLEYYPFTNQEKSKMFDNIVKNRKLYDIFYPFRFKYFDTNLEQTSDNLNWNVNDEIASYLSTGEKHIRNYTIEIIKKYKLNPKIVYDPACSTGEFLKTIKDVIPTCKTIGHDMSEDMVNYSKKNVDESKCCNAFDSPIENNSVDLLILRFLNGGVVNTNDANKLFDLLIKKVKKNGYIICIGHTPILIKKEKFKDLNLELIEQIGYNKNYNSIFQYYLARKR